MSQKHQVVIIGGGFGGLHTALKLKKAPVEVTLIDRRNFHLFQPLLYQVATGALSPADIASPLRNILKKQRNTRVLLAEAKGIDAANRHVLLKDGNQVSYDTLIVATGATHHYFGHDDWAELAPGLKTIEDATKIRSNILLAFEAAEKETDPEKIKALLTFVVVGGGPTGVELAGALAEIANDTLKNEFRHINPGQAQIILVEALDRILTTYPEKLSRYSEKTLQRLGVNVRTQTMVTALEPGVVVVKTGDQTERISTHTVLWGAGVRASTLGQLVAAATDAQQDKVGRIIIEPDCTIAGHPEIFVIGDLASYSHQTGKPLPGVAQVAMQQGKYAAKLIQARLKGEKLPPFQYNDLGNMATIGRGAAIADLNWIRFGGFIGWLVWLFIHLMSIVDFENRFLVLTQWAWQYWTRNRSARLVTGESAHPLTEPDQPLVAK